MIIRQYFKNLYTNKLENLEEMYKFLGTFDQPKLNQEYKSCINISLTSNKIKTIIESSNKEKPRTQWICC
jgi:hypothetical protein